MTKSLTSRSTNSKMREIYANNRNTVKKEYDSERYKVLWQLLDGERERMYSRGSNPACTGTCINQHGLYIEFNG